MWDTRIQCSSTEFWLKSVDTSLNSQQPSPTKEHHFQIRTGSNLYMKNDRTVFTTPMTMTPKCLWDWISLCLSSPQADVYYAFLDLNLPAAFWDTLWIVAKGSGPLQWTKKTPRPKPMNRKRVQNFHKQPLTFNCSMRKRAIKVEILWSDYILLPKAS